MLYAERGSSAAVSNQRGGKLGRDVSGSERLGQMTMTVNESARLEELESRIRAILPEEYQDSFQEVKPVSMGSAGLKYRADGRVAWDEIWGSFCDLAMAGGPPHKGTLLEPGRRDEIELNPNATRRSPKRSVAASGWPPISTRNPRRSRAGSA